MGKMKGPYQPDFPEGTAVRVKDREFLEQFAREWRLHNPLQPNQLDFAGVVTTVTAVGFYHGGDELYSLNNVPGIWHEQCLQPASERTRVFLRSSATCAGRPPSAN